MLKLTSSAAALAVFVLCGCATSTSDATTGPIVQQAAVTTTLEQWKQGLITNNVDEAMSVISDEFASSRFTDKQHLQTALSDILASNRLDNASIDLQKAAITVEGANATAYPIHLTTQTESRDYSFQLRREDGKWRIIGIESIR